MPLGFGLLSAQARPGETDWQRAYDETIELTRRAEALGYSSVWTTEHHFVDDGYMPSLFPVSAAMAMVTERIEIGTGVLLAPLHHPLRIAEDAATVSLLSNGRFTLGLGLGWSDVEFAAFDADLRKRGRAMSEILDILPRAWSGEVFSHQGDVYQLPELAVRPTPSARLPVIIGGGAEAAVRRAARQADGFFGNAPVPRFIEQVGWALDELRKVGRDPDDFRFLHYSILYPAPSAAAGWDDAGDHIWHLTWKYRDMGPSATRSGANPVAPPLTPDMQSKLAERAAFVGPSDYIVAQLHAIRAAVDVKVEFMARSFLHTLSFNRQLELMEQLSTEVAPHV
ncbi:MAG: LLM class flavin-dependent oxidoreductase [Acidimicrobiia bacterium]|nr:LLM class flavin-dependent oxidoreductase [Acidimicrobiia bacterium]